MSNCEQFPKLTIERSNRAKLLLETIERVSSGYSIRRLFTVGLSSFFAFCLALYSVSTDAADFRNLNFPYTIYEMSADGVYFVSAGSSRHDMNGNSTELGDLPGGTISTWAMAINGDGSICAGYSQSDLGKEAFLWSEGTGIVGLGFVVDRITGLSADGTAMVGELGYWDDYAPFYWTAETGVIELTGASTVNGISADGTVVCGTKDGHGFSWTMAGGTMAGGFVDIGRLHGNYGFHSDELKISADGTTIIGRSFYEAFRWTAETGIVLLGDLNPTSTTHASHGHDVSADGTQIVGWASTEQDTYEAMIWSESSGMTSLNAVLADAGVSLEGLRMTTVLFVSDDGRRMIVEGVDPYNDTHKFFVNLDETTPEPPAEFHKLFVVNKYRRAWEYELNGNLLGDYSLHSDNDLPKGAASRADGTTWVVDDSDAVFVYNAIGDRLGSWQVSGLSRPEGIAVLGDDILIVDRGLDKVLVFEDAASWVDGRTASASSSWSLKTNKGNKNARGITTDGNSIWVVNTARTDRIYQYSISGVYLGRFNLDSGANNKNPRGIAISPDGQTLSVVDISSDKAYEYSASDLGLGSISSFSLNSANNRPEGIAEVIVP